jgi:hypothetical protein
VLRPFLRRPVSTAVSCPVCRPSYVPGDRSGHGKAELDGEEDSRLHAFQFSRVPHLFLTGLSSVTLPYRLRSRIEAAGSPLVVIPEG